MIWVFGSLQSSTRRDFKVEGTIVGKMCLEEKQVCSSESRGWGRITRRSNAPLIGRSLELSLAEMSLNGYWRPAGAAPADSERASADNKNSIAVRHALHASSHMQSSGAFRDSLSTSSTRT